MVSSGIVRCVTALAVLAVATVKATIDTPPTGTVACTSTGFSPTFGKAFETNSALGWEVFIGSVANTATGTPICSHAIASIADASTGITIGVTELNSGNEIPYVTAGSPTCSGAFENSGDGTTVDYHVDVDIVVTETHRGTIKRQLRYPFNLKCSVTRDVNANTGTERFTVNTALVDTAGVADQTTAFTFPISLNFYTTTTRDTLPTNPFAITQGSDLFFRVKETTDNNLLKFTTEKCWSTPDANHAHGTSDIFFQSECPVDETVEFTDKTDASPNFDFQIEAFFFSGLALNTEIYFHCDVYICKQDDTAAQCVQDSNADCTGAGKRKRREVKKRSISRGGPIEIRTLTSKQHVLLSTEEILVPECPRNSVYDREAKKCAENNIVQVEGVYLDIPWQQDLANTSSEAFKKFAQEKAYQLYALLKITDDADNILGVKVVGARQGSVILDVQVVYKPTINSSQAFQQFKKAIHDPAPTGRASRIVNILNIRREKTVEFVEVAARAPAVDDVDKMTLIVLVVVLAAVIFIAGVVALKVRQMRRAPAVTATFSPPQVKGFDNPTLETVS